MTLKKKLIMFFSLVSLSAIIFIIFNVYGRKTNKPSTSPVLSNGAKYQSLQPGVSTIDEVSKVLGPSIDEKVVDNGKVLEYKSKNPNFNNEARIESDKLTFVKQIVTLDEDINISGINEAYGNYENVLYKSSSENGFNLYIYPSKGMAYIGHQSSGIVLEIWYFPPTTFEDFKNAYAQSYGESPKPDLKPDP